ncbi:hypothetical protein V1264_015446 [Littorina saxatilis]|uniref:Uncharacterized protein n=1 Tax=Littorina saxatilis TaxID=31220 RepID=A0AAN9BLX9_9CAEN
MDLIRWNCMFGIFVILATSTFGTDTIYMQCDPNQGPNQPSRVDCPADYCCVKDEFDTNQVYCEKIGQVGEACTVQPTVYDCPCATGLTCKPNIHTAVFVSMFGRCFDPNSP